jgi:prevent-host-death family protein
METVDIHDVETLLSRLLERVRAGEEIMIAQAGEPIALLVPYRAAKPPRKPGALKGKIHFDESFFDPLPEEELRLWEGR